MTSLVIRTSALTVHWTVILDIKYWFEFKWCYLTYRLENSRQMQNISLLAITQKYLTTQCHNWPIRMEVLYGRERNIIFAVTHFNSFCGLQWLLWRNADLSVSQQLLNEVGDVSSCYRDVLYTAANHITFCLKDKRKQKSAILVEESSSSICLQMPLNLTQWNSCIFGLYITYWWHCTVCISVLITTGMAWVTPSPLSITTPVSVRSPTCLEVHDAANAKTAWKMAT